MKQFRSTNLHTHVCYIIFIILLLFCYTGSAQVQDSTGNAQEQDITSSAQGQDTAFYQSQVNNSNHSIDKLDADTLKTDLIWKPVSISKGATSLLEPVPNYRMVRKVFTDKQNFLLAPVTSNCINSDFSFATFTNWQGCYGNWTSPSFTPACNNPNMPWYNTPSGGRFEIITAPAPPFVLYDPCISAIPQVYPGETHSALIGNRVCFNSGGSGPPSGQKIDRLIYPFNMTLTTVFLYGRLQLLWGTLAEPTMKHLIKGPGSQ